MVVGALVLVPFIQIPSFTGFGKLALFSVGGEGWNRGHPSPPFNVLTSHILKGMVAIFGTFIYLGQIADHGRYTDVCYDQYVEWSGGAGGGLATANHGQCLPLTMTSTMT